MSRSLSPLMRKTLRDVIHGEITAHRVCTVSSLIARGLLQIDGTLSLEGWRQAVEFLPLTEQCKHMNLCFEQMPNPDLNVSPELAAWNYFKQHGFAGSYCEGGAILLLIRAASLDTLSSLSTLRSRADACTRYTEAQLALLPIRTEDILKPIMGATTRRVVQNFVEIYSYECVRERHPGLTPLAIRELFDAIGPRRLADITAAIMADPYTYRRGWPDLTMVRGGSLLWAEIKTSDRLHMSQIVTLSRMKDLLPGSIRIIQLT